MHKLRLFAETISLYSPVLLCFVGPPVAHATEDDPLHKCNALKLIAQQELPAYGEMAILDDGKKLAFLSWPRAGMNFTF